MSNAVKNGGAAFPQAQPTQDGNGNFHFPDPGMTLRDWFAGQAMAGMGRPTHYLGKRETDESLRTYAQQAYQIADAMLAAREATS